VSLLKVLSQTEKETIYKGVVAAATAAVVKRRPCGAATRALSPNKLRAFTSSMFVLLENKRRGS